MYHIHPLSTLPERMELPKCMYNIKPLNEITLESLSPTIRKVKMNPELQLIEDRQLTVIARLRQMREAVDGLIRKAGGNGQQQTSITARPSQILQNTQLQRPVVTTTTTGTDTTLLNDLVIEANPNRPPLSLVFIRSLIPNLRTISHTHSSCTVTLDKKLISLFSRESPAPANSTIRVVWKNISGSRLTPPTLGSCGVEGESNVARYLSRVLAKSDDCVLNYDALPLEDLVLVDNVLESSNVVESAPEQFLNSLQAYIQKKGSGYTSRTVADFVGYSTLQYLTKHQPGMSIQKSLIDWMNGLTNDVPSLC